jgi:DNA-binding beta-propeller fold protein YncE
MRTVIFSCIVLGACSRLPAPSMPQPRAAEPQPPPLMSAQCFRRGHETLPARLPESRQGGAVVLVRSADHLLAYVADADSRSIHTVSVDEQRELVRTRVPGAPRELLVLPDGRVVATLSDGTDLAVLEPGNEPSRPLTLLCKRTVPAEPWGLALSPHDTTLVVTSGWGGALTVLDAATLAVERTVPLPRDPRDVLVDDADVAFVSHLVGAKMSAVPLRDPTTAPTVIDLAVSKSSPLSELKDSLARRTGSQGYALAKVGLPSKVAGAVGPERILAPMASVDPGDSAGARAVYYGPQFDGIPKEAPTVSVVDPATKQSLNKYLLGMTDARLTRECLLPHAAAVRAKTATLLVACFGIDALLELDALAVDPFRAERRRVSVPAGPQGVAVDEATGRAVVFSQLGAALTVIDLDRPASPGPTIDLDYHPEPELADAAKGRRLFYRTDDVRITSDGLACSSCHIDGRDDAVTWTTPSGSRQTPMLAGRLAGTAPYGWEGNRKTLTDYISNTISNLGGSGLTQEELDDLSRFLLVAKGPPRMPSEGDLVRKGHDLFEDSRQQCGTCHLGGDSDTQVHELARTERFDTPSLRFVRGTAPYFHDGRYATLEALLADPVSPMGHTASLSEEDRRALAAYLRSL